MISCFSPNRRNHCACDLAFVLCRLPDWGLTFIVYVLRCNIVSLRLDVVKISEAKRKKTPAQEKIKVR